jgi:hypothetical protein
MEGSRSTVNLVCLEDYGMINNEINNPEEYEAENEDENIPAHILNDNELAHCCVLHGLLEHGELTITSPAPLRQFMTTPFESYTVTEGFGLLIFTLFMTVIIYHFIRRFV